MNLRPALLAAAALAAAVGICLALGRWGAGEYRDLLAVARGVQRGEELDSHFQLGWRHDAARRVLAAEVVAGRMSLREAAGHFRRLDEAAPTYPPGIPHPAGDESFFCERILDLVWVDLAAKELFAAAARCYGEAFTAHPQLLTGHLSRHRYRAACAAARAGCGEGQDAGDLDETHRAGFRRQARDWLRAELEARRRLLVKEPGNAWPVAHDLLRWLEDPAFDGVREPDALARLPAAEQQAWQQLWAGLAELAREELFPRR
jgi:hypothetical protein